MKKSLLALSIFASSVAYSLQVFGATAASSCPAPQSLSNMTLTFDSEFSTTGAVNTNQWRPYVGQHGTPSQELEVYVPGDVKVSRAQGLILETDKTNYWDHQYTSGEVVTQGLFSQAYGHFEAMAMMPEA